MCYTLWSGVRNSGGDRVMTHFYVGRGQRKVGVVLFISRLRDEWAGRGAAAVKGAIDKSHVGPRHSCLSQSRAGLELGQRWAEVSR